MTLQLRLLPLVTPKLSLPSTVCFVGWSTRPMSSPLPGMRRLRRKTFRGAPKHLSWALPILLQIPSPLSLGAAPHPLSALSGGSISHHLHSNGGHFTFSRVLVMGVLRSIRFTFFLCSFCLSRNSSRLRSSSRRVRASWMWELPTSSISGGRV